QRHPEIWFDDGNIVLVAHKTAFRIYGGLLAGQSTVFSDMFASSSPDETFEGCPVVHLSDSPPDLVHLLRVLLPIYHWHPTSANPECTFDEISAVIRLAHKYNIPRVQDQALTSLHECDFPTSFAVYFNPPPKPQIALESEHSIDVVNLARLTDTPSLLPLVLYDCAILGSDVFDAWTHEDGSVEHLSEADLRRCVDAHVALTDERTFSLSYMLDDTPSGDCERPDSCVAELRRFHPNAMRSERLTRQAHVLMDWREAVEWIGESGALCKPCTEEVVERNERERKNVFDKLPETFGITVEGWGAAEKETEAGPEQGN
ncbi:hypothetical protein LXA43DRAFT_882184, partial [Ganoderma leucocontextum]